MTKRKSVKRETAGSHYLSEPYRALSGRAGATTYFTIHIFGEGYMQGGADSRTIL